MFKLFKKKKITMTSGVNEEWSTNTHDAASAGTQNEIPDEVSCTEGPDDISLVSYWVDGIAEGKRVALGMNCFYHKDDQTVYIEERGPGKRTVRKYPIPDNISKNKEEILIYLIEEKHVYTLKWRP